MVINDPAHRFNQLKGQNSVLSQILDNSEVEKQYDDESSDFLGEAAQDFNLDAGISAAKGPSDLLT